MGEADEATVTPRGPGMPSVTLDVVAGSEINAAMFGFDIFNSGQENASALNAAKAAAKILIGNSIYQSVVIRLPAGRFVLDGSFKFGRDGISIGVRGQGRLATLVLTTSTSSDPTFDYDFADPADNVPGAATQAQIIFGDMTVIDYVQGNNDRPRRACILSVKSAAALSTPGLTLQPIGGRGVAIDAVIALNLSGLQVDAYNNTALDIRGTRGPTSGLIDAARLRVRGIGDASGMQGPPVRISGAVTGVVWGSSNRVGGAGPRVIHSNQLLYFPGNGEIWPVISNGTPDGIKVASITSSSSSVAVTTEDRHNYSVGDIVGLYNVSGPYTRLWTVASVPDAHTVIFAVASDPGSAGVTGATRIAFPPYKEGDEVILHGVVPSVYNGRYICLGMADIQGVRLPPTRADGVAPTGVVTSPGVTSSYFASVLIDNEFGPVNECSFSGGLIEGVALPIDKSLDGSYAVVIDASRSRYDTIYSTSVNFDKLDAGHRNILVVGNILTDGTRAPSDLAIKVDRAIAPGGNVVLNGPSGKIEINGLIGIPQHNIDETAFGYAAGLRITGRPNGAPVGVSIIGGSFGAPLGGTLSHGTGYPYGIVFDGVAGNGDQAQLVTVKGTALAGTALPIAWLNGADPATQEMSIEPGTVVTGAWPTDFSGDLVPSAPVSGGSVAFPVYHGPFKVVGSGTLSTITGVWKGRTGNFLVTGAALTTNTSGNIGSPGATYPVGSIVEFRSVSGKIYLR